MLLILYKLEEFIGLFDTGRILYHLLKEKFFLIHMRQYAKSFTSNFWQLLSEKVKEQPKILTSCELPFYQRLLSSL